MSTGSESPGARGVPTMPCRVCETDVPAGAFCGLCGAHLSAERGDGRGRLRLDAYGAAPGEHVLRLSVTSSLFPHLPQRSRTPFRVGLATVLSALVVFALLRWQAPLIAVSALGLPLLFHIYLQESDAYDDLPRRTMLLTAVLGVGLGVGWALLTGAIVARSYDDAIGSQIAGEMVLRDGLAIPLGGAILMLVPAVLVRILRPPTRESLDGFVIGATGAITFTATATLTRLASQFATGLTAGDRPIGGLIVEAGIHGVAAPLTAAAVGGMVGAALWFTRRTDSHRHRGPVLAALVPGVVVVLGAYAGLGLTDIAQLPQGVQLGLHLVVMVMALLALRIALQAALLHEAHDEIDQSAPLLCPHCSHVVPDMAFCPNCGAATRASSRSSRTARRLTRPVQIDPPQDGP